MISGVSRHQELENLGNPLPKLTELADWDSFRPLLDGMHKKERKNELFAKFDGQICKDGHARARVRFGLINMPYNIKCWRYLEETTAWCRGTGLSWNVRTSQKVINFRCKIGSI